jgi:hypothetical protein
MVVIIDEIFDRDYHAGRAQLNASIVSGLRSLGATLSETFKVLNRIEYSAPWALPRKRARFN